MKKIFGIFVVLILCSLLSLSSAQTSCRVLKPQIDGSYTGECRNGLAEGKGEATGVDFYKGDFVKGLPDGKGVYIWKNGATYDGQWKKGLRDGTGTYSHKTDGGKDTVLTGKWKKDEYLGNPNSPRYSFEYRNSISRVSVVKVGDRPYIQYKFSRNGKESNNISNLLMQGSSGTETSLPSFTGFERVSFPFKGKLTFNAPNAFQTASMSCELRFTIYEPGAWIVTLYY
ncbi:MAG: hypothetical protein WCE64_09355 [Bacteroidales bacterium]